MSYKGSGFAPQAQPRDAAEKSQVASEIMGGGGKHSSRAPRFHRMSIEAAENGVTVDHEPPRSLKKDSAPTFGNSTKHVIPHDHPVMKHVHAIHSYCSGSDGDE